MTELQSLLEKMNQELEKVATEICTAPDITKALMLRSYEYTYKAEIINIMYSTAVEDLLPSRIKALNACQDPLDSIYRQWLKIEDDITDNLFRAVRIKANLLTEESRTMFFPDDSISMEELHRYGYHQDGILPLRGERAKELLDSAFFIFALYQDNTESLVEYEYEIDNHAAHGGLFGISRTEWNNILDKQEEQNVRRHNQAERLRPYTNVATDKVICLDIETTGLDRCSDEILQLSIVDGNGKVLFDEYIKPTKKESWPEAAKINGITPDMVANKLSLEAHIPQINKIIADSNLIVGYNSNCFDIPFMRNHGIDIPYDKAKADVMLEYAKYVGEPDDKGREYKWHKLEVCAHNYGYDLSTDKAHNSVEDAKATMYCWQALLADLRSHMTQQKELVKEQGIER